MSSRSTAAPVQRRRLQGNADQLVVTDEHEVAGVAGAGRTAPGGCGPGDWPVAVDRSCPPPGGPRIIDASRPPDTGQRSHRFAAQRAPGRRIPAQVGMASGTKRAGWSRRITSAHQPRRMRHPDHAVVVQVLPQRRRASAAPIRARPGEVAPATPAPAGRVAPPPSPSTRFESDPPSEIRGYGQTLVEFPVSVPPGLSCRRADPAPRPASTAARQIDPEVRSAPFGNPQRAFRFGVLRVEEGGRR